AKFLAGCSLVLLSIIPTLIYYYSVYELGSPQGNLDTGGMWGSYIGLLFLGAAYVSIGIFASSLTGNQIVAFILAVFLCFLTFIGFESLSSLTSMGRIEYILINLGIQEHYASMSRGVIDSRDVLYFI